MHSKIVVALCATLGSAQLLSPAQLQALPSPVVQAVPVGASNQTISYNAKSAYSNAYSGFTPGTAGSKAKRTDGDCSAQPLGSGATPSPDTDTAFLQSTVFSQAATGAITPAGWYQVFQNQQSAISTSAYMGYKSYSTYDPSLCAADCLASTGCLSFNLFFERDPSLNPGPNCPDPASTTVIKCSFWGAALTTSALTNSGQYRDNFHVVIAGSNGYQLTNPGYSVPGFNGTSTGSATINAPNQCGSYITFKSHTGPYDPNLCAADCAAERANTAPFNGQTCRFFASYQLLKNGVVQAQICSLYTQTWDSSYAVNTGYWSGSDVYTIANAMSYTYSADIGSFSCGSSSSSSSSTTTSSTTTTASPLPTTLCTTTTTAAATTTTAGVTSLTACPSPVSYVVATDGQLYTLCQQTDYQIPSPDIWYNVPSAQACTDYCESSTKNCIFASYNPSTKTCYSKGNPSVSASNWVVSTSFQTLQKVPDGTPITSCPSAGTYTTAQNGCTFHVCPKTDYNYPSPDIWYNVQSEQACINLCAQSSRCNRSSYRFDTQTCYGKGTVSPVYANLVVQSHFNTYQRQ